MCQNLTQRALAHYLYFVYLSGGVVHLIGVETLQLVHLVIGGDDLQGCLLLARAVDSADNQDSDGEKDDDSGGDDADQDDEVHVLQSPKLFLLDAISLTHREAAVNNLSKDSWNVSLTAACVGGSGKADLRGARHPERGGKTSVMHHIGDAAGVVAGVAAHASDHRGERVIVLAEVRVEVSVKSVTEEDAGVAIVLEALLAINRVLHNSLLKVGDEIFVGLPCC